MNLSIGSNSRVFALMLKIITLHLKNFEEQKKGYILIFNLKVHMSLHRAKKPLVLILNNHAQLQVRNLISFGMQTTFHPTP